MTNKDSNQEQKPKKKSKKWIWIIVGLVVFIIVVVAVAGDGTQTNTNTPIESEQSGEEQIIEKEKALTDSIQSSLDTVFKDTEYSYRVEVEIGDINSSGVVGWLNVYPQNDKSWGLMSDTDKKDFVSTLITISRNEIDEMLGQVYVKNDVRILAEGKWDALKGNIIELK